MKKILAMALSVAIIATIAISGTIAYFTDEKSAVNTFTVGNVVIDLLEEERSADGKTLVKFTQGKRLMPLVGSAQGAKDDWGLSTANNYVDKIVRVENVSNNDAYVRVFVAVPAALEKGTTEESAGENFLHWNVGNKFDVNQRGTYNDNASGDTNNPYNKQFTYRFVTTQKFGEETYNVYCFTRNEALKPEEISAAVMVGMYLDSRVDYNDEEDYYFMTVNGTEVKTTYDLSNPVNIPVYAEAVQAAGFANAQEAFSTAIEGNPSTTPGTYHPWTDGKMDAAATVVDSSEAMDTAITNGATEIVLEKAGTYIIPDSAKGKTLTISGNKNTVVEVQDDGSYEKCDYSFDGAKVTFNGVTITTDSHTYAGYARLSATYNNCTINGTYTLYGDSVFNNCTFNVSGDMYNVWTWGAPTAEFNNCIFNCSGKSILLYGGNDTKLIVKNCTFNDDNKYADVNNKAAIEVGSDWSTDKKEIVATGVTVNGFDITNKGTSTSSTLWGNKNSLPTNRLSVTIDGTKVY